MSKLHNDREAGRAWSKQADGEGTINPAGLNHEAALQANVSAQQKTVTIQIDSNDVGRLQQSGHNLCFAKKIGTAPYNVVWQSYGRYLGSNNFSWRPIFQLFGSNMFRGNAEVQIATGMVSIDLGEQSTLDYNGVLSEAVAGGPAASITINNDYGQIHAGLTQLSTGPDGSQASTPIYVTPDPIRQGTTSLTPADRLLVWFEQRITTGTMFSGERPNAVEIDLTAASSARRLYQGGRWTTP